MRQIVPIRPEGECGRSLRISVRRAVSTRLTMRRIVRVRRPIPSSPMRDSVLDVLLPKLLQYCRVPHDARIESLEHSAPYGRDEERHRQGARHGKGLTRTFNKVRQAAITREVSEITAASKRCGEQALVYFLFIVYYLSNSMATGTITQIIGPVVDVRFDAGVTCHQECASRPH